MKRSYRYKNKAHRIQYARLSDERQETFQVGEMLNQNIDNVPFDAKELPDIDIKGTKSDGDWGSWVDRGKSIILSAMVSIIQYTDNR